MNWVKRLTCWHHEMKTLSRQTYPTYGKVTEIERCIKCGWWKVTTTPLG